jgi:hypothetical protein
MKWLKAIFDPKSQFAVTTGASFQGGREFGRVAKTTATNLQISVSLVF